MSTVSVPAGYQQIMPYLILNDASAFQVFMEKVFNATEKFKVMRDENTVMHAEVQVGESVIMFADVTGDWEPSTAGMFIYVEDADSAYSRAMDEGATSIMKLTDQPYGRTCGVRDPFGNTWWITTAPKTT